MNHHLRRRIRSGGSPLRRLNFFLLALGKTQRIGNEIETDSANSRTRGRELQLSDIRSEETAFSVRHRDGRKALGIKNEAELKEERGPQEGDHFRSSEEKGALCYLCHGI
ncbi:unnamed protein product [Nezara viridula]|uniref:Uncharacterized protein n=1 Tax=Nezara viridula TaxID=85310 RepID=A0A9P0MR39_NEZVI|nr:unnamed protein product [Nezara viridula]